MFVIIRKNKVFISLSMLLVMSTAVSTFIFPLLLQETSEYPFAQLVVLLIVTLAATYSAQFF